jgi:hypothetical protein
MKHWTSELTRYARTWSAASALLSNRIDFQKNNNAFPFCCCCCCCNSLQQNIRHIGTHWVSVSVVRFPSTFLFFS